MEYRDFTDQMLAKMGDMNWGMLGKLSKQYQWAFLLSCTDMVPDNIKKKSPSVKTQYLSAIARKHADNKDLIQTNNIDWSSF